MAFLGRYGHQSVDTTRKLPRREMLRLAEAVGYFMDKETAGARERMGG